MPWPLAFANLFSSGSGAQQSRDNFGFVDDGLSAGKQTFADVNSAAELFSPESMAQEEGEEEGRPPYIYVRAGSVSKDVRC